MNDQFMKGAIISIGVLIILVVLLPVLLDTTPIRPHENDVIVEGYTIVALVCYNCATVFDRSDDWEYINSRIWCNHCVRGIKKREEPYWYGN